MKLRQTLITGSIILIAGAYKTFKDYCNEDNVLKKKTLTRDIIALGAASSTVFATDYIVSKRFKSNHFQNFAQIISQKIIDSEFLKYIIKQFPKLKLKPIKMEILSNILSSCIKDISLTMAAAISGLAAGILTDELMYKNQKKENITKNENEITNGDKKFNERLFRLSDSIISDKAMNDNTKGLIIKTAKIFENAGFIYNPLDKTGAILSGLDISKEKNIKKVFEQTSTGIVAGAIIPAFIVSICNTLTKNRDLKTKVPILALGLYLGDYIGSKASKYLTREVKMSK